MSYDEGQRGRRRMCGIDPGGRKTLWRKEASSRGENACIIVGSWQRSSCLCCGSPANWISDLVLPPISVPWSQRSGRRHKAKKGLVVLIEQTRTLGFETLGWDGRVTITWSLFLVSQGVVWQLLQLLVSALANSIPTEAAFLLLWERWPPQFLGINCVWQACKTHLICRQKKIQGLSCPCGCCVFQISSSEWKPFNCRGFGGGNSDCAHFTLNFRWPFLVLKCI